jgi:hypothetical protein
MQLKHTLLTLLIVASLVFILTSPAQASESCKGSACRDVEFRFKNGCHVAKNVGDKRVKASIGAISVYLYPGDEKKFTNLDGRCLAYIVGGKKAKYVK